MIIERVELISPPKGASASDLAIAINRAIEQKNKNEELVHDIKVFTHDGKLEALLIFGEE